MKKSLATLIDELTVTNIKIFHLMEKMEKNKNTPKDAKKLRDLNKYRLELRNALDTSKAMNPVRSRDRKSHRIKKDESNIKINKNTYTQSPVRSRSASNGIKKSIATLIDELTITNLKIFHLVDKIEKNKHTRQDAKKAHDLNRFRSELCNSLNRIFKERENIKV